MHRNKPESIKGKETHDGTTLQKGKPHTPKLSVKKISVEESPVLTGLLRCVFTSSLGT